MSIRCSTAIGAVLALSTGLGSGSAYAQNADDPITDDSVDVIIVESSRRGQAIEDIPRSVRVFDAEDIAQQIQQTTSVQEILGKVIPGFAPPVTEGSAASLSLRGREPLYLLDGVPIASNTNFSRFLDKFDPLTIGRVEVVYGPTALYGAGAAGGVIQFFTTEPKDGPLQFGLGTQLRAYAPSENAFDRDGFTSKVNGSVSGNLTDWLSIYGYASFENTRGGYSADGDLLSGRSVFANDTTYFGKVRAQLTENQSLTATVNRTTLRPSDRFFELTGIGDAVGLVVAEEAEFPITYAQPPTNEFLYVSGAYNHADLIGGDLSLLFYYSESEFLNPGSDIRAVADFLFPDGLSPGLWQSGRFGEEYGVRGQYVRDITDRINVAVGFDFNSADSTSLLPASTEEGFDETLFFDAAIQLEQAPPFTLDAVGVFFETGIDITDRLTLSGGVRWDRFDYEVIGPYDIVFPAFGIERGPRPGGSGASDGISYNVGATYEIFDRTTVFANFSQGFTIPSLGFVGNTVDVGVAVSDSDLVDPVITESYEAGVRGAAGRFRYAVAAYFSQSEFSTTVGLDPLTGLFDRDRAPVEIYGVEASGGWDITDELSIDANLTWIEGQTDPDDTGDFIALSTQDIPPLKVTIDPKYQVTDDLSLAGQIFIVGDRSDGFIDGTDRVPAEGYTLVDFGINYNVDAGAVGEGLLSLQVTNLFNNFHIPPGEATFIPGRIRPGLGRAITLSYQHDF